MACGCGNSFPYDGITRTGSEGLISARNVKAPLLFRKQRYKK